MKGEDNVATGAGIALVLGAVAHDRFGWRGFCNAVLGLAVIFSNVLEV